MFQPKTPVREEKIQERHGTDRHRSICRAVVASSRVDHQRQTPAALSSTHPKRVNG